MKTLADHVLDIVQNSIRAKATLIEIIVEEDEKHDICSLQICDNGCGMDTEILEQATNPFFTTRETRKVGLGLSLLKQNAEMSNGKFNIWSELNRGTKVEAVFQLSHLDRPELGEIWDVFYLTMQANQNLELVYTHKTNYGEFSINSNEILSAIEGISLQKVEIRNAVIDLIRNNINAIKKQYSTT